MARKLELTDEFLAALSDGEAFSMMVAGDMGNDDFSAFTALKCKAAAAAAFTLDYDQWGAKLPGKGLNRYSGGSNQVSLVGATIDGIFGQNPTAWDNLPPVTLAFLKAFGVQGSKRVELDSAVAKGQADAKAAKEAKAAK